MAITNHEQVGRALKLLGKGLYPYIEREMKRVYKEGWLTEAKSSLNDDYKKRDLAKNLREDVHPLLALMLKQWEKVFKENLGHASRALVSELHETRNNWAHQSPFSTDDAYRTLDSIARLLKNISAPEADIVEIEKQKQEVLIILSKEQARYEVSHPSVSSAEESRIREKLAEILKLLPFQNACLLNTALTHRSYFYENPKYVREDNERLEFLGDAVLTFLSSEFLYNFDSEKDEGTMTRLRSKLVDEKQLAEFANDLDIGKWMRLGKGETESQGNTKLSLLSNYF